MALIQAKPDIMKINPYIGGEAKVEGVDKLIRLASNENPLGCSKFAMDAYKELSPEVFRYPDGACQDLRDGLAEQYELNSDNIVCGAGSEELISLLIKAYAGQGDEVLYPEHGFLMYPISAMSVGAKPVTAPEVGLRTDIKSLLDNVTDKTKLLFIANPNNPTGSYISDKEMRELRDNLRSDVLLIIDSAYAEFVTEDDYSCGKQMVEDYDNVVMLRTFSKAYGLAGLRVGWSYCSPDVAGVLNRVRGPFNVNMSAQVAAIAALKDQNFVEESIKHNIESLKLIKQGLDDLGIKHYPSVGNFILADFGDKSEDVRLSLRSKGIFIRQMGAYNLPTCLRISLGTMEENEILLRELKICSL